MMSEDLDSDTRSPQGWAIIGAFLGVLLGYINTLENTPVVATSVIIGAGAVGAIIMNEIEYQFISSTGITAIFSILPHSTSKNSVSPPASPDDIMIMLAGMVDQPIDEGTSNSLDGVESSKYGQLPYFVPIDVDEEELVNFVSKHQDQFDVYPSYLIVQENHNGGLVILHPALLTENKSSNVSNSVWYFSGIHLDVSLQDKHPIINEDAVDLSTDWLKLDESEDGPNSIEELMDWGDEDQSGS